MKIKYRIKNNGQSTDFCFTKDNYILLAGEQFAIGQTEITEELVEGLHSDEFKIIRDVESQKNICVALLARTDHKTLSDYAYPNDQPLWLTYRKQLRDIMTAGVMATMPDKPF
ncbi:hypothetical protein LCGC14_2636970 [marine sediment metagenome]|uniref:Uncharacterized protein n=1 Tax=marine sediment metagenome TaxID=412755 RepID=A0A0F8ZYI3_9ZZZZ